jgi:hypothetical protein
LSTNDDSGTNTHSIIDTIIKLEESHREDLGLVKIVYPAYFKSKTATLGNYYGIYKDNQLVAVTGERMQMNDFIEVSAVIHISTLERICKTVGSAYTNTILIKTKPLSCM